MPPKKKAAAAASPLSGCSVAVSGTFTGTNQSAVQKTITDLGGTVAKSVTADTNYLVSTEADVKKLSAKVKAAQSHDIPIVSLDWLNDSAASNAKEDPGTYLLTSSSTANGKKRAASPDPSPEPEPKKKAKTDNAAAAEPKFGEGSVLKSRDTVIPVDEEFHMGGYQVYVDDDGVVYDASLNQTNASNNNNKFYRVQLLRNRSNDDYKTWTRWGRVGDRGQSALLGSGSLADALKQYDKKFKDKSGLSWNDRAADPKKGKYAYVERSYAPDDDDDDDDEQDTGAGAKEADGYISPTSTLPAPVQSLMQLIFNQQYMNAAMSDLNYDANKMPLGKLSKATINRGFQVLKDLAALFQDGASSSAEIEDLSNRYYSLIPHNFGRSRPPVIADSDRLKKEIELLDSLGDMKEAAELMKKDLKAAEKVHPLDRQFRGLNLEEMTVLDAKTAEFKELSAYLNTTNSVHHGHNYEVDSIFRIERNGEHERFEKSKFSKVKSDRRLLWHGSRATNFGGILSQGLRIAPPEAPVSGYMFGKGIYLADMSSKSAGYCCPYNSGGHALLLLCEAELGSPMQELTNASYNAGEDAIANGSWSTWGKGTLGPPKWKDAGSVHPSLKGVLMPDTKHAPAQTNVPGASLYHNEYIAYDIAQVRLRYLLRVKM